MAMVSHKYCEVSLMLYPLEKKKQTAQITKPVCSGFVSMDNLLDI